MHMSWLDWTILIGSVVSLTWFSLRTARYMRSVADFLSANRSAGRYLLTLAGGMSSTGAISVVAMFEMYYASGFPPVWWGLMLVPTSAIILLTGWIRYRFRETRCMTVGQFLEVRYGKGFRVYSGIITWLSGIVNFGIFPAVASRFFVYFCGFPDKFTLWGITIPTFAPIMILTLGMALAYTCLGGQITVMMTDCVQGIFCGFGFIILCVFLLNQFAWTDIVAALKTAPEGMSMLNPFETGRVRDFNVQFFLILLFFQFYGAMSWQGSQAYESSGLNPHEQKMGGIISVWRQVFVTVGILILTICAFTFLNIPKYAEGATAVHGILDNVEVKQIVIQQRVPVALAFILPSGLRGIFAVMMVFLLITTQDTYMHSWGSIFIQDVILPFRKKPFKPEQQMKLLRWSILFVAVFAFFFSLFYKPAEYIQMFLAITGAIVAGHGAVIIGGLYTRWGASAGAWVTMTVCAVLAVTRIIIQQFKEQIAAIPDKNLILRFLDKVNTINMQVTWFYIMLLCIASYVILSLLFSRKRFNLKRMLHRGKYDLKHEHVKAKDATKSRWLKLTGITEEFTFRDRLLAIGLVAWNFTWFAIFIIASIYNLFVRKVPADWWITFWRVWVLIQLGIGIPVTIWFTFGGVRDIGRIFKRLATLKRDERDDGRVVDHHLASEEKE